MYPALSIPTSSPIVAAPEYSGAQALSYGAISASAVTPPRRGDYTGSNTDTQRNPTSWWTPIAQLTEPKKRPLPGDLPPATLQVQSQSQSPSFVAQLLAQAGQQSSDVMQSLLGKASNDNTYKTPAAQVEDTLVAGNVGGGSTGNVVPVASFAKSAGAYGSAATNVMRAAVGPSVQVVF